MHTLYVEEVLIGKYQTISLLREAAEDLVSRGYSKENITTDSPVELFSKKEK